MTAYATAAQLTAFLAEDTEVPPSDAEIERLLQRATDLLDEHICGAWTPDDDDLPDDATIATAFANAVCAQVEFWLLAGEEHDIEGQAGRQASAGGATWIVPPRVAPRAYGFLRRVNAFAVGGVCVGAA